MGFHVKAHKGQMRFLYQKPKARFRAAIAGVQGGKTLIGDMAMALAMEECENETFMITAPSYKMLDQSTKPTFLQMYGDRIKSQDSKSGRYHDKRGNTLFFRSTDDPNSLRGPTLKDALMDECTYSSKKAFDIMVERLAVKNGKLFLTTTPRGNNWLHKEIWLNRDTKNVLVSKWPSYWNPVFPKEEYQRIQATSDETWFKQEYDAEFVGFGGLIFAEFNYDDHVRDLEYNPELPIFWSMDFGIANPTIVLYWQLDEENQTYKIVDELWLQNTMLPVVIERALERYDRRPIFVACDPAGYHREMIAGYGGIQLLKEYDLTPRSKSNWNRAKSRMIGINILHKLFRTNKIAINRKCYRCITSLEGISYRAGKEGTTNDEMYEKDGVTDHAIEAMIYFSLTKPEFEYIHTVLPHYETSSQYTPI